MQQPKTNPSASAPLLSAAGAKNAATNVFSVITGPFASLTFIPGAIMALVGIRNVRNTARSFTLNDDQALLLDKETNRQANHVGYALLAPALLLGLINFVTAISNYHTATQEALSKNTAQAKVELLPFFNLKSSVGVLSSGLTLVFGALAAYSGGKADPDSMHTPVYTFVAGLMFAIASICIKAASQDHLEDERQQGVQYVQANSYGAA